MSRESNQALFEATDAQDLAGVKKALAEGADVNAKQLKAIHASALAKAIDAGSLEIVDALLEAGASVHDLSQGRSLLFWTSQASDNQPALLERLLDKGLDPLATFLNQGYLTVELNGWLRESRKWEEASLESPTLWAKLAQSLMEHGLTDPDRSEASSLLLMDLVSGAFSYEKTTTPNADRRLMEALDAEAGVALWNAPLGRGYQWEGWTLMLLAANHESLQAVEWFLDHGADLSLLTPEDQTDEGYPSGNKSLVSVLEGREAYDDEEKLRKALIQRIRSPQRSSPRLG